MRMWRYSVVHKHENVWLRRVAVSGPDSRLQQTRHATFFGLLQLRREVAGFISQDERRAHIYALDRLAGGPVEDIRNSLLKLKQALNLDGLALFGYYAARHYARSRHINRILRRRLFTSITPRMS